MGISGTLSLSKAEYHSKPIEKTVGALATKLSSESNWWFNGNIEFFCCLYYGLY